MLRFEQRTVSGRSGEALIVSLVGSADIHSTDLLEAELALIAAGRAHKVVLDLGGVDILSSLGIGVLVGFRKKLSETGRVAVLACVPEQVRKGLKFTRVTELFAIFPTVDRALAE